MPSAAGARCFARRWKSALSRRPLAHIALLLLSIFCVLGHGGVTRAAEMVELPTPDRRDPIAVAADEGSHWTEGEYEVWLLHGNCYINQGLTYARSHDAVLWIEHGTSSNEPATKVIAYLEGDVEIDYRDGKTGADGKPSTALRDKQWFGRFYSTVGPQLRVAKNNPEPDPKPAVYRNAQAQLAPVAPGTVQQTQFVESVPAGTPATAPPPGNRRIRAFARGNAVQAQWFPNPAAREWVAVINSGVNVVVDGLRGFGSIDISADRVVIWTSGDMHEPDLTGQTFQREEQPLEIYMEGNVEFRQGDRLIKASSMYYDVRNEVGTILNAEALTPAPKYSGLVRLKADVIHQVDRDRFVAENATLTTSRIGDPTYRFVAGELVVQDTQTPLVDPATGAPKVDPRTGAPLVDHDQLATATNGFVYLGDVPVFYWPTFATELNRPSYYINKIQLKSDSIFGTQILTDFDSYQLLGIRQPPKGTEWDVSLDYLSKRGPATGTTFKYDREGLFDIPGRYAGMFDAYFIHDSGMDDLGADRRVLIPPTEFRGRVLGQHRQYLPDDWTISAELGYISDRNFLEQYFEREYDTFKDESTDIEIKKLLDNQSFSLYVQGRLDNFDMDTDWLPRLDHYWIGQPLFNDLFTYYEHSHVGYARDHMARPPSDPNDAPFAFLPYEANVGGEVAITRQEIDLPFELGPVKVVPYALGELAHWGEALDGNDFNRAYGQLGIRLSLPMEAVDPTIESDLFNVHGIAHKVVFSAQAEYTDASQNMTDLPLYEQIDDNAQEQFRRRLAQYDFGGPPPVPQRFDERFFALRSGLAGDVTSPSAEIADDLMALRLDVKQRWQTKRGIPGQEHIIDWIVLDTGVTIFNAADNFGNNIGLANYDFAWHVGDRTTIVSDGFADFFPQGGKEFSVGVFLDRPPRGNLYLGFRSLQGPIDSDVIIAAYNYRMSPKWVSQVGASVDLSKSGNIGEHFSITHIGESFLATVGANVDASRGVAGFTFALEPRFLPKNKLTRTSGLQVLPSGAYGLE